MQPLSALNPLNRPSAASARRPAQDAGAADPTDTATVSQPRRWSARALRETALIFSLAAALSASIVGGAGLVEHFGPNPLISPQTPQHERVLAQRELDRFGDPTVDWLGQKGVRIRVTHDDQEVLEMLRDYGALHAVDRAQLTTEAVEANARVTRMGPDSLVPRQQKLQAEMQQLTQQWLKSMGIEAPPGMSYGFGGMAGMGGMVGGLPPGACNPAAGAPPPMSPPPKMTPAPPRLLELQKEFFELQNQRMANFRAEAGDWAGVFPGSVAFFTQQSGATTPEQQAEFRGLLQAANGDRLARAQAEALARLEEQVAGMPPGPMREFSERSLEQMRANPDTIPMQTLEHRILVPPVRYVQIGDQTVLIHNRDGEGLSHVHAQGLYFGGTNQIQVDDNQLGGTHTLSHEIGHAIEDQLREHDPEFYQDWIGRVDTAFQQARQATNPASGYGLKNRGEYIAEGVRLHFEDPQGLAERDPALASLTAEMLQRAGEQGKSSLLSSLILLGMAGMSGAFAWLLKPGSSRGSGNGPTSPPAEPPRDRAGAAPP